MLFVAFTGQNIGVAITSEYYLKDASGNTVGILDYKTGEWTWYVFGRERFAKIKPIEIQQPAFYNLDHTKELVSDEKYDNVAVDEFVNEVKAVLSADPRKQVQLLKIEQSNGSDFWISESNLTTFTDTIEDSTYTIAEEIMLSNTRHQVKIGNNLISVGALMGTELALSKDSISLDTTTIVVEGAELLIIRNLATDGSIKIHLEPDLTGDGSGDGGDEEIPPLPPLEFNYTYHRKTNLYDVDYYIHDHLGNTRVVYTVTDVVCGGDAMIDYDLKYAADYYPYGKILREWVGTIDNEPEKYLTTHHERDKETGLDYRGARYYDADIARFLSLDPLAADFVSWSPYNYVFSNPVILIDPDGRAPWNPVSGIGDGIARSVESSINKLSKNISEFGDDVSDFFGSVGDWFSETGQKGGDIYTTPDGNVTTKENETKGVESLGQEEDIEAVMAIAKAKKDDPKAYEQSKNKNIKSSLKKIGGALNASSLDGRTQVKAKPDSIFVIDYSKKLGANQTLIYDGSKDTTKQKNTIQTKQDTVDYTN